MQPLTVILSRYNRLWWKSADVGLRISNVLAIRLSASSMKTVSGPTRGTTDESR